MFSFLERMIPNYAGLSFPREAPTIQTSPANAPDIWRCAVSTLSSTKPEALQCSASLEHLPVNLFALAVGTMIALLFFTIIMSRVIHHEPLPAAMIPSLLIMMAPFEEGFLAYTNFTQRVDTFSGLLFYFGLFLFLTLAPKVFRKGIPFASGWWAISFPMAALASAALKYSMFAQAWPVTLIAIILLALLSIAIAVLFVRTLQMLLNGRLLTG